MACLIKELSAEEDASKDKANLAAREEKRRVREDDAGSEDPAIKRHRSSSEGRSPHDRVSNEAFGREDQATGKVELHHNDAGRGKMISHVAPLIRRDGSNRYLLRGKSDVERHKSRKNPKNQERNLSQINVDTV